MAKETKKDPIWTKQCNIAVHKYTPKKCSQRTKNMCYCVTWAIHKIIVYKFCSELHPLLISTGFLKYPLELKKKSVRTEKKIQL